MSDWQSEYDFLSFQSAEKVKELVEAGRNFNARDGKGASFGRFGGWRRRYPGGSECRSIFLTVSRAMPNRLAASRWLRPSTWQASRTRRYRSTVYILPPSISKKIEDYRWQSFTPPAAGKSRRFRGLICHRRSHKSHYGYKNHVNVDRRHKLVRRYQVTDAAVHDSQVVDDILDPDNTASEVWADSAYRSAEIEAKLKEKGLKSRIHRKGYRNKPLSEREKRGNTTRSKVRARVEHVFGAQSNDMGGTLVRSIGMVRARARIGLKNLAYNMRRLVQLERLATAPT